MSDSDVEPNQDACYEVVSLFGFIEFIIECLSNMVESTDLGPCGLNGKDHGMYCRKWSPDHDWSTLVDSLNAWFVSEGFVAPTLLASSDNFMFTIMRARFLDKVFVDFFVHDSPTYVEALTECLKNRVYLQYTQCTPLCTLLASLTYPLGVQGRRRLLTGSYDEYSSRSVVRALTARCERPIDVEKCSELLKAYRYVDELSGPVRWLKLVNGSTAPAIGDIRASGCVICSKKEHVSVPQLYLICRVVETSGNYHFRSSCAHCVLTDVLRDIFVGTIVPSDWMMLWSKGFCHIGRRNVAYGPRNFTRPPHPANGIMVVGATFAACNSCRRFASSCVAYNAHRIRYDDHMNEVRRFAVRNADHLMF